MKNNKYILFIALCTLLLPACRQEFPTSGESDNEIRVGGIALDEMTVTVEQTRADQTPVDAETVSWLVQRLKQGFDITYGQVGYESETKRVAILKLQPKEGGTIEDAYYATDPKSGYAVYTFNYRGADGTELTAQPAQWYGNGPHFFEGVHVPNRIRYNTNVSELANDNRTIAGVDETLSAVTNLTTKQNDDTETGTDNDLGNYTLLAHYLGMPANTRISATVGRIKLPFRHRLAHVNAYILIDPALGSDVRIKGYELDASGKDNPETTDIKFCNVEVLEGVHDTYNSDTKIHTLTPRWTKARKVIPRFEMQEPSMRVYRSSKSIVRQGTNGFATIDAAYTAAYNSAKTAGKTDADATQAAETATGFKRTDYTNIPVYDIIVRPTYTSVDNVMYDEEGYDNATTRAALAARTNQIYFELSLNNNLTYTKNFEFDLDANYETSVYLMISREGVDYNESGSELWQEHNVVDDWYGLDNTNGNTLSLSGSSWQRAYINNTSADYISGDTVTDGGFYNELTPGEDGISGQYLTQETWLRKFLQAYEGGANHGDYFILGNDITIDASRLPIDFVFTGHLDAFDPVSRCYRTITLTGGNTWAACDFEPLNRLKQKTAEDTYETIPNLYWMTEIAQAPARRTGGIPVGTPVAYDMATTRPSDLAADRAAGKLILYEDTPDHYAVYPHTLFYRMTAGSLFAGLNGNYLTAQEEANPSLPASQWEANVHCETRDATTYWVPYRTDTDGWRAELINIRLVGGTLFPPDEVDSEGNLIPSGAIITGNVENCRDANGQLEDHTPAIPWYK